ncbi:MAG TPA: InlB B-repeat-containing protein [Lachnospiraceae bacterium]|nr:InlB B-repeat-containing protein [Lachnospiraceae bacterium]
MKKRILSILLALCMLFCLVPTTAFAEGETATGSAAIQLGTDALSKNVNTATASTVYFGQDHENNPAAWRVIGYNGNGVASAQGDMTLLAAGNMSSGLQFADFGASNEYAPSNLKTAIDALAKKLTTEENVAVKKRTLTSGGYTGENTDCVAGGQVDNAVFWPLSSKEANAVKEDLRVVDPEHPTWATSNWWLRSPGYSNHDAATVRGDGSVVYSGNAINSWWCARPAFNLNSSSVLFTSAAVGGKPDGGLTPISEYTGNEWKLTLKDSNRNFAVTETTVSGDPGDTVTLHYTGATAGINEYISVILADNSGAQYYGRVAQPTVENGTVEIKIPSGLAPGSYTLKVFSEQCNGEKKTDYASDFVDIDLTVGYQEQFSLAPGGTYYFDLSGENIPGTANGSLPDASLHYVPFTYAGTVNAYKLTSAMATTDEYAQQNKYAHSLFVADYAVTHAVRWYGLNDEGLIFGKNYASGGVDYTLRAPSVGSDATGLGDSDPGVPQSNEWDTMLNKDSGYIQNWNEMFSWGQDTVSFDALRRAVRGYDSARHWLHSYAARSYSNHGFRPVLEVRNPNTLGPDGLKAVTLALGGGKLGGSSDAIHIIVKTGSEFTAPASDGLNRPDGNTGSYFMWLGSDGKLYAPGARVPADVTKLTAQFALSEQFSLKPGGRYYFDLSGEDIPGTVNGNLPDSTLHYVPFTYAGTIEAYKLTSAMATTEEYAQQNKYAHSLFIADYNVTHTVSWDDLNTKSLIFGKNYASGGVDYTLRAPSVGSNSTGLGDSRRGVPQSNEWDAVLNKNSGYIQNWNKMYLWGQDVSSVDASYRARRGYSSARNWYSNSATGSNPSLGFRPVLEVLNAETLGSDGLKVVTLDLGGGTLGNSSEDIQIIVKTGSEFTAPASDGMTRPDGNTGSYFMWLGSNGNSYAPGGSVPADVTKLTAQFALSEQFSLTPGGTYYFDLSAMGIPGTVNDALPDNTLHYVPFTYAGTVDAYKLMSEMATTEEYAQQKKYPHSLFVADYVVTHTVSWNDLDTASLIFGKDYVAGSVDYTLRAPSVGSSYTGSGDSERGTPKSNEWDKILDKDDGYIKNWREMLSCGQDTTIRISASSRAVRGWNRSARFWTSYNTSSSSSYPTFGFRPVLEVPNPGTLGADGLKAVTLNLGGGKLGGSSDAIHIIVKNGSKFTAPASGGLTRPAGDTGSYFMWLDSNGNSYAPGASVPADVTELTVQWTAPTYTVTLNAGDGTINSGNVISYTYGVGATLPTDVTRTGYTFKGWYDNENLTSSPVTAISNTETGNKEYWAKWEINQYTITVKPENGKADITITQDYGTPITAPADPTREGYTFIGWGREIPTTMPAEDMTVTAQWKDSEKPTGEIKISENSWKVFLNNITFGLFFKDTQTVTITAVDNSGETVTIEYLLSNKELTKAELDGITFTAYTAPFGIDHDNEYIIYVRLTDKAGNTDYICSDGIVLDGTSPVITGIEDGKIYCEAQNVTIDEKYVDTVTVNGTEVTLDENNSFTLAPADGEQKIVVTDKAGNTTEMTVTVNNGHTGGTATCTEKAVCEVCGKAYGEPDPKNHTDLKHIPAKAATEDAEGNIEYWYCGGCGKYYSDKDGTKELAKADTVTAKLPKSPQTGDISNLMLWIALLFVGGGVLTGVTVFDNRKRHSVK